MIWQVALLVESCVIVLMESRAIEQRKMAIYIGDSMEENTGTSIVMFRSRLLGYSNPTFIWNGSTNQY
jgi:hypothetical protein